MRRFDDWPTRLDAFILQRKEYAGSWGSQDCCMFACDAVLEMTGVDLATDFRGKYSTAAEAAELLRDYSKNGTVVGLAEKVAENMEIGSVPVNFAQRGDVVALVQDGRDSLGIVSLSGDTVWAPGELGLIESPIAAAITAWRI